MLKSQKNSKKQADVGQALAIAHFASSGYTVLLPLSDSQLYDLVVEINDKLCKVQVKTTYYKNKADNYEVVLKTSGWITGKKKCFIRPFDSSKVDFVFVVTECGDQYVIPANVITSKYNLTLTKALELYKVKNASVVKLAKHADLQNQ